ncbi:MAG TPA: aspartate aminotransferase family protein, partial [Candidatus Bathyarchaeota archaeon]|nr:aspartate aminotransferase family protein [Candidatus Bathyarchaeota archaeon]
MKFKAYSQSLLRRAQKLYNLANKEKHIPEEAKKMVIKNSGGKIEEKYLKKHPKSRELYEKAKTLFARGVTHDSRYFEPMPIYCVRAKGSRKWDVDGNEYIDYWMGHGALILGHAHPVVTRAATEQARKGTHLGASHKLEIEWAEKVTNLIPCARGGLVEFTSSGTEATMMAIRIARAYTGKKKIIKFLSHFHGWFDYTIIDYNPDYSQLLSDGYPTGIPPEICRYTIALPPNDIEAVEKSLEKNNVACVILEPGGASMGLIPSSKEFLEKLRKITRDRGVILIFDEVVTGFRDAPGGAQEHYGVIPDMATLGKILGGGYPGGAVTGRREYMSLLEFKIEGKKNFRRIRHPGTFNANPLSAAAGNACLGLILEGKVHPSINRKGEMLKRGLSDVIEDNDINALVWGTTPSIIYIGFGMDQEDIEVFDIESYVRFREKMDESRKITRILEKALINRGIHPMGPRLILSIAHTKRDIEATIEKFDEALK